VATAAQHLEKGTDHPSVARQTVTTVVDDLDDTVPPVPFTLDGTRST